MKLRLAEVKPEAGKGCTVAEISEAVAKVD